MPIPDICLVACIAVTICASSGVQPPCGDEYEFATDAWQDYVSHIVASEARGVEEADIVVACTLVRDVKRGWGPWALRGRWFGWGTPDEADRNAVLQAVTRGGCVNVPEYRYVGNFQDVQHWRAVGMIHRGPYDLYVGPRGQAVVGVP